MILPGGVGRAHTLPSPWRWGNCCNSKFKFCNRRFFESLPPVCQLPWGIRTLSLV